MATLVSYDYEWDIVWDNLDELWRGLLITIQLAVGGMAVALVLGLVVVSCRMARSPLLSALGRAYIWFIRGVPLFVFLFWIYYGLARTADIVFGAFTAGLLALGLTGSGYMAEIYRGGLQSVDPGQREAGLAIGLGRMTTFRRVVFPQAIRIILAPTVNLFVGLLKGATIIGVHRRGRHVLLRPDRVAAEVPAVRALHGRRLDPRRHHHRGCRLRRSSRPPSRPRAPAVAEPHLVAADYDWSVVWDSLPVLFTAIRITDRRDA